jgi:hypothetical protein
VEAENTIFNYMDVPILPSGLIREGWNTLAVHVMQGAGDQFIDAGIVEQLGRARRSMADLETYGAIRINCAGPAYTGSDGTFWSEDRGYASGRGVGFKKSDLPQNIRAAKDDDLFFKFRWFFADSEQIARYAIPLPPGTYRVRLHFAEVDPKMTAPGRRVFSVQVEGKPFLEHYDIVKAVDFATRDTKELTVTVDDGRLDVHFIPEFREPMLSALEIIRVD